MKLDPILVRKEREERAWSQEHLAEVSGLSLRTIQRVESDGNASHETRLSLAAAFGLDVAALTRAAAPSAAPLASSVDPVDPGNRLRFRAWTAARLGVVGACLVAYELSTRGGVSWSLWPLLGLGIAAVAILVGDKIRLVWTWGAVASGLLAFDAFQAGRPTWSIWVAMAWILSVALPWLRRRGRDPGT